MIDWTQPLVVAGTDRVATLQDTTDFRALVWSADWGSGQSGNYSFDMETGKGLVAFDLAVANAPPTPKLGPEHIEALELAEDLADRRRIASGLLARNCQSARGKKVHEDRVWRFSETVARLAEIRAYLERL